MSLLDRLAIVGTTGTGALEYKPSADLTEDEAEIVHDFGSSNGARPKMFWRCEDG